MIFAAERGHLEVIRLLLNGRADVDKAKEGGVTPLYVAAELGHTNVVRLLLVGSDKAQRAVRKSLT